MANLPILTATLDNCSAQLSAGIAANTISIPLQAGQGSQFPQPYSGTATSLGTTSTLNCTGISATIGGSAAVGLPIRNVTDGSWAFILTVATNSLTTTALQNGSDNLWENTDAWRINEMVVTLENRDGSGNVLKREKALISGRSTDTLTLASAADRGFDNSTATTFSANDYVVLDVVSYTIRKIIEQCSEFGRLIDANITSISKLQNGTYFFVAATGSANAYVAATPALSAYAAGNIVVMLANFTNTGTATLNLNGLGAKTITRKDGATNLVSGDVQSGQVVILVYDGTNFQLQSPSGGTQITIADIGLYGNGADSAVVWSAGTNLDPTLAYNYTTATLNVSQTLSVSSVNTPLVIKSTGNVTINGTIDLNGKGGPGGAAGGAGASGAAGTAGNSLMTGYTNGAGGGGTYGPNTGAGGGSGASTVTAGTAGTNGAGTGGTGGTRIDGNKLSLLANLLRSAVCGGGGGGASGSNTTTGSAGGAGGGALVWMVGGSLTLGASSIIRANGSNGTTTASVPGGGAGAGGTIIFVVAGSITNSGVTASATGGTGGTGGSGVNGANGPAGQVLIYSLSAATFISA